MVREIKIRVNPYPIKNVIPSTLKDICKTITEITNDIFKKYSISTDAISLCAKEDKIIFTSKYYNKPDNAIFIHCYKDNPEYTEIKCLFDKEYGYYTPCKIAGCTKTKLKDGEKYLLSIILNFSNFPLINEADEVQIKIIIFDESVQQVYTKNIG